MPPKTPTLYKVPPGTKATTCKGPNCRKRVYWIRTERGKALLIDCDVEGGQHPSEASDASQLDILSGATTVREGFGVSHFTSCIDAERF